MLKAFCIFLYMVYFGKTKRTFLSDFWSSKVQIGLDGESLGVKVIHWQGLPLGYQPVCPGAQIKLLCDKLELFPSPQSPAKPVWKIFTLIIHSKLGEGKLFETPKCMEQVSSNTGTVFPSALSFMCIWHLEVPTPDLYRFLWCLWTDAILRLKRSTKRNSLGDKQARRQDLNWVVATTDFTKI